MLVHIDFSSSKSMGTSTFAAKGNLGAASLLRRQSRLFRSMGHLMLSHKDNYFGIQNRHANMLGDTKFKFYMLLSHFLLLFFLSFTYSAFTLHRFCVKCILNAMALHQPKMHTRKLGKGLPGKSGQRYKHSCTNLCWQPHQYCARFQVVKIQVAAGPMSSNARAILKNKSCVDAPL